MPRKKKPQYPELKQRSDGRWRVKYRDIYFYSSISSDDAYAKRDHYIELENNGLSIRSEFITFKAYAAQWLPTYKSSVSDRTYNHYASSIDSICRYIGDIAISEVTQDDIANFYSEFVVKKCTVYARELHNLCNNIFETAVENNICQKNPCKSRQIINMLPKGKSGSHRSITQEERTLIETVKCRMQIPALIMLYAGLRSNEMRGIDIDRDIDFDRMTITVNGSVTPNFDNGNYTYVEKAKTRKSYKRVIPLFSILVPYLKGKHGLILHTMSDGFLSDENFYNAWATYNKTLSKAAGHPVKIRPHDLRHSFTSWAITNGADVHVVSEWLGHTSPVLTQTIYDHVDLERNKKSVKSIEEGTLGGQTGGQWK